MLYYLVLVQNCGREEYLFNTRMLVRDQALARQFTSPALANRYFKSSCFADRPHTLVRIGEPEPDLL